MNNPVYAAAFRTSVQLRTTRQKSSTFRTELSVWERCIQRIQNFTTWDLPCFYFFLKYKLLPAYQDGFLIYATGVWCFKSSTRSMRCKFCFPLWGRPENKWGCRHRRGATCASSQWKNAQSKAEMRILKVLNWGEIGCKGWVVEVWYRAKQYLWLLSDKAAGLRVV